MTRSARRWAASFLLMGAFCLADEAAPPVEKATDRTIEGILMELLDGACDGEDFPEMTNSRCQAFEDAGLLTTDNGVVLKLDNGSEFQISIIQSRRARGPS